MSRFFLGCLVVLFGFAGSAMAAEPVIPYFRDRAAQAGAKPDLAGRRVVRFLTSTDYPPFQFLGTDGAPAGFNVDLARDLCTELALSCTVQALPWDQLQPALDSRRADALIAGLRPSVEAREKLGLTRPYFRLPARFAAKKGSTLATTPEGLKGKKVAVVEGSAHEAYLTRFFPGVKTLPQKSLVDAEAQLKQGLADAVFGDGVALSYWLASGGKDDCCAFIGGPFTESRYFGEGLAIAVRPDDTQLRIALDYALDELENRGTLADLYLRWFPIGLY